MNARLSSLLVAGGVVLAGIQSGSLSGALPDAGAPASSPTLEGASLISGAPQVLKLAIPGFSGAPRLQVLANPARVVVDLPGVNRGVKVTKKDMLGLASHQILRSRMAQFATVPQPVTRVVLEVVPGTQAEVTSDATGVSILLNAGQGAIRASLGNATEAPIQPVETAPELPDTTSVAFAAAAPDLPALVTARDAVSVLLLPAVAEASARPSSSEPVAPYVIVEESPKALAPPPVLAAAAPPSPLVSVPAIGAPFQALPALAVQSVMPATLAQDRSSDRPLVSNHQESRSGRTLGESSGRYTGARMTIDVTGTDLVSFLRIIADTAHLNLIADQDVQGIYTFKFTDTPWDQVLDVVLKHAGLGKEVSNGIIRVAKVDKLQKEEEDRKRLDDAKALAGEVQSISRPLSFAKATEARAILDKMLTKRGSIIIDERTNTLIITDLPRNLPLLDDLIAQLDVQIQQVQIEARVVEANKNWEKDFGVKWPTSNTGSAQLTNSAGQAATWGASNGASWNSINNRPSGGNQAIGSFSGGEAGVTDLPSPAGEFWVSFLTSRMSINVILQALEKEGVGKIVSSPKVVTQNNKKAKILSGAKIPYPAQQAGVSTGAISVAFADANLELDVTPQITNDGTIIMDIVVIKDDANFDQLVGSTPTITQKRIETQVLVKDGGTAIMGGVYKNTNSHTSSGVPFLNKLPLIGFLFRNSINQDTNDELLIFITPRILKN